MSVFWISAGASVDAVQLDSLSLSFCVVVPRTLNSCIVQMFGIGTVYYLEVLVGGCNRCIYVLLSSIPQ